MLVKSTFLENAGKIGLPIPDILKNAVKTLQGKEHEDTPRLSPGVLISPLRVRVNRPNIKP